jgi:hypothetical protein
MLPDWIKEIVFERPGLGRTAQILGRVAQTSLFMRRGGGRFRQSVYHPAMVDAVAGRRPRHDISDHLGTLFFFAVDARPRLLVELGTRGGESTRALLAAASVTGATLLSVDRDDCSALDLPDKSRWHFVQSDDVAFGQDGFLPWCRAQRIDPTVDLLFIDTSHRHEHITQELAAWLPHFAERGTLILHDTNLGRGPYARLDGSSGFAGDNQRGIIRAVEELVGRRYDEATFFTDLAGGYLIMHHAHCGGLTVLKRVAPPE